MRSYYMLQELMQFYASLASTEKAPEEVVRFSQQTMVRLLPKIKEGLDELLAEQAGIITK